MKLVTLSLIALLPSALTAQITLGPDDMPDAGDTMRYRTTTLTDFNGDDTGPAYEWHFEALEPQTEMADTAVSVSSTPLLYQFFFNNEFIYPEYAADYALRGQSFDFQLISLVDVYDYYKKESTDFRNVGFGATVNGLPASVQRDPIDFIYHFPLNYADVDSSASNFAVALPGLGAYAQEQMRYNEVDGWGTLYLPADTFEVLRVKSRLQRTDSIYVEQFDLGFSLPEPETIEYKWLAMGMDQPVLQITTLADIPTLVRFYYQPEDISTGVLPVPLAQGPVLRPNPANDRVRITTGGARALEILDTQGRLVRSVATAAGGSEVVVELSDLMPGVYTVRRAGDTTGTRLVISR